MNNELHNLIDTICECHIYDIGQAYQCGCTYCGMIYYFATLPMAQLYAKYHQVHHHPERKGMGKQP